MVALSANSHKVHSLMRMLGMEDPVFDARLLDAHIEPIVARARAYLEAGPDLRDRLLKRSQELGAQVDHNLDWLGATSAAARLANRS